MQVRYILALIFILTITYAEAQSRLKPFFYAGVNYGGYIGKADTTANGTLLPGLQGGAGVHKKISRWDYSTGLQFITKNVAFTKNIWNEDTLQLVTINFGNDTSGNPVIDTLGVNTTYDAQVSGKIRNLYIELPISISYFYHRNFYIKSGIQVSYVLRKSNKGDVDIQLGTYRDVRSTESYDDSEFIKNVDLGLHLGGGYQYKERWQIELLASYGFIPILKKSYSSQKLNALFMQLQVGFNL